MLSRVRPFLFCLLVAGFARGEAYTLPIDKSAWQLPRWATNVNVVNQGPVGEPSLRVSTSKRDYSQQIRLTLFYPADVASATFVGQMKTDNVMGGAADIEKCRAQLVFLDDSGERLGNWPQTTDRAGTTPWEPFLQQHKCPPGTRAVEVWLGMYLSTGVATFSDLKLTATDAAGNELQPIPAPTVATDTAGWWRFEPGEEDTSRPLVLDFAPYLQAPAGKFGFVTEKEGHFVFDNGQRARFWGVGYVKDWQPAKDQAPIVAERLARAGINLVRFHGMDAQNPKESIFDPTSDKTDRLDPDKMDRLDFFFNELKKRGIYADLNLLTKRRYLKGDGVVDYDKLPQGGKAASIIDRRLIDLQKDYARLLLTHVNPYTQLAYKDDPAVAMLEINNEVTLNWLEFLGGTPLYYEKMLDDQFTVWCTENKIDRPNGTIKVLIKRRENTAERFVEYATQQYFNELHAYLKNELKITQPISGTQFDGSAGEKRAMSNMDFIDHHGYWDHPAGGWDPLCIFRNKPLVLLGEGNTLIEDLVANRVAGRAYTVSEWNFCWPNDYITEGPLLMGAYAGFNDWDAPMMFGTEGLTWSPQMKETFNQSSKPQFMVPMLTAAMMFYRADVAPGPVLQRDIRKLKAGVKLGDIFTREQKLTQRCELVTTGPKVTEAAPATQPYKTVLPAYTTSDGQIDWESNGKFVLDTPRTQAVVGFTADEPVSMKDTTVKAKTKFAQIIVSSLTTDPIRTSPHVLITATARAENSGAEYRLFRKGMLALGDGPILIEPVQATVAIKHDGTAVPKVYALDWYGRRTEKTVPVAPAGDGRWSITLGSEPAGWFEVQFSQ